MRRIAGMDINQICMRGCIFLTLFGNMYRYEKICSNEVLMSVDIKKSILGTCREVGLSDAVEFNN